MRVLMVIAIVCAPGVAWAGDACFDTDGPETIRALERYAAGKGTADELDVECIGQWYGDDLTAADEARVVAACVKVAARAKGRRDPSVDPYCVMVALASGAAKAGTRDLVGEELAKKTTWMEPPPYGALARSGDPRVRPFALERFQRSRAAYAKKYGKKKPPTWAADLWRRHQLAFVGALALVGMDEDLALLDELAAGAGTGLLDAIANARAAISAR